MNARACQAPACHKNARTPRWEGGPFPRALPGKHPGAHSGQWFALWPQGRGEEGGAEGPRVWQKSRGPLEPSSKPHQTLACMHTMRSHAPTGGSAWHIPRCVPPKRSPPHTHARTHTALRRRHAQLSPQSTIVHNPSLACAPAWPPNHLSLWPPAPRTSSQGCIGCVPGTTPCQQHTMPPSEKAPSSACACCEGTCARATRREPLRRHPARPQAPRGAPRGAPRRSPWGGPPCSRGEEGGESDGQKNPARSPRRSPWGIRCPPQP